MIQNALDKLCITGYLKIKYNNDVSGLVDLLRIFNSKAIGEKWIVDLNGSWDPEDWFEFLKKLEKEMPVEESSEIVGKILYLEQPYKLELTP